MGIFGGIGNVKATEQKGVYLPTGRHLVTIERCKLTESTVGNKTFFVVESTVMESSNEELAEGTRASWVVKLGGDYPQMALADIKKFTVAATGADEDEIDEAFMQKLVEGPGDLVAGRKVMCEVEEVQTKKGGVFSKHFWSALKGAGDN
mgnify:FL=1|tara:strand:- start:3700 stop:4146 length:447 start_codon:yes stop_codon:yes gene_type:complete